MRKDDTATRYGTEDFGMCMLRCSTDRDVYYSLRRGNGILEQEGLVAR